jgi:hypothetical protein
MRPFKQPSTPARRPGDPALRQRPALDGSPGAEPALENLPAGAPPLRSVISPGMRRRAHRRRSGALDCPVESGTWARRLDVRRQALNVAVLVAGSACSVPLSCSLRAGPAAGTARVQPWWGKVNVGAVAGALAAGAAECGGEAPGSAVGPSSIHALAARRSGASRSSSVQSSAGAGTKGTGAVRDRSRTDFSGCRVRAGSAERGGVMLRSGAGSRISLPRWRDPSLVCRQQASTVADQ